MTVKLKTGELVEIDHFQALHLIGDVAVFTAPGKIAVMFDSDSVLQVIDAPASDVPNRLTS